MSKSKSDYIDFRAVKAQVTMLQVLEHYGLLASLHRNGNRITGTCPIHGGDNQTAFRADLEKNCWNCFSKCGCGGNVLDFVEKKEGVSLIKAAHLLVEWFHLEIDSSEDEAPAPRPRSDRSPVQKKKAEPPTVAPVEPVDEQGENKPLEFELRNLQPEHPFLTERGLSPETIHTFGLGYCTKGIHNNRIAIPIHNATGQLVAYAGRTVSGAPEKYQFPKGFKKSLELFNLHRVATETSARPLVIVEGFFDVMNLWQYGARRVVALMGRHLSPSQAELIRTQVRDNPHIIVMLDEDDAGREARDLVAARLARFAYVKVHTFAQDGTQPDMLTAAQVQQIIGGWA